MSLLLVGTISLLLTMAMSLVRASWGPTHFDRILAANMFGTKTVLLIAMISFLNGRPDFIDLAIVYALINFIGIIAILRFWKMKKSIEEQERNSP